MHGEVLRRFRLPERLSLRAKRVELLLHGRRVLPFSRIYVPRHAGCRHRGCRTTTDLVPEE
jgi:hypothetical protein